jgi:hypothetical protein
MPNERRSKDIQQFQVLYTIARTAYNLLSDNATGRNYPTTYFASVRLWPGMQQGVSEKSFWFEH